MGNSSRVQNTDDTGQSGSADPVAGSKQLARKLQFRIVFVLFRSRFLPYAGIALFIAGGIILGGRFLLPQWNSHLSGIVILSLLTIAAAAAGYVALRRLPDRRKLLIWLDTTGGLLSASLEVNTGSWHTCITTPELPEIHTKKSYAAIPAAIGLLFLAGALFCPVPQLKHSEFRKLDITEESTELKEKLEVLEEESLIPQKELAEMKETLREVQEKNSAGESGKTYELLESLTHRVDAVGEHAGSRSRQAIEAMNMLSDALAQLAEVSAQQFTSEVSAELAEAMSQLAVKNPELAEALRKAGFKPEKLNAETMRKLAETLKKSSKEQQEQLAKLLQAKLMKNQCRNPGGCEKNGKCSGTCLLDEMSLDEWLSRNAPEAESLLLLLCEDMGNGGISKGRGDAELNYTGNTKDFTGKKKDVQVDALPDPSQSNLITTVAGTPDAAKEAKEAKAGSLQGGKTVIEQRKARIYPEHRAVVERYFEKDKRGNYGGKAKTF